MHGLLTVLTPKLVGEGLSNEHLRAGLSRCIKSLLCCALFTFTLTSAQTTTLKEKSPFLPPDHNVAPPPPKPVQTVNGPISREVEFRGVIQMGGVYQFSIFNKKEQRGYWIRENETQEGIGVRSFDPDSMSITIEQDGRSERLTLMTSTDSPLPVATSTATTSSTTASPAVPKPVLPPGIENLTQNNQEAPRPRVIPRRRVILPRK